MFQSNLRALLIFWGPAVLLAGLVGGVSLRGAAETEDADRGYIVKVGDPMPDFRLELIDGRVVTKQDLAGKVVMLQFTASWCSVCRKEMPFIEREIWQRYRDREDFFLAGVDRDEPLETVRKFARDVGVTYPLALDPGAEIFALVAHKEAGVTRNVILDRDGRIAYLTRLFDRAEFEEMKAKIAELLGE
ncbi:MAG: TlpA disulfide reductase family protein [Acidobacteriota bacterium]